MSLPPPEPVSSEIEALVGNSAPSVTCRSCSKLSGFGLKGLVQSLSAEVGGWCSLSWNEHRKPKPRQGLNATV